MRADVVRTIVSCAISIFTLVIIFFKWNDTSFVLLVTLFILLLWILFNTFFKKNASDGELLIFLEKDGKVIYRFVVEDLDSLSDKKFIKIHVNDTREKHRQ